MIPLDRYWDRTRFNVEVTYRGLCADGTWTSEQSCYLPWEGSLIVSQAQLEIMAARFFAAKYGPGQDHVIKARLWDRETLSYVV